MKKGGRKGGNVLFYNGPDKVPAAFNWIQNIQGWFSPFLIYENMNNWGDAVICSKSSNQLDSISSIQDTESNLNSSL